MSKFENGKIIQTSFGLQNYGLLSSYDYSINKLTREKKNRKFKRVFSLCENGQKNGSVFWALKRCKTIFVFFFKKFLLELVELTLTLQ